MSIEKLEPAKLAMYGTADGQLAAPVGKGWRCACCFAQHGALLPREAVCACGGREFGLGPSAPDMVNHPPHYRRGGMESIDVIEAFQLGFCLGNTVKYILRAGHKGDRLEDLKKAMWFLRREIDREQVGREGG